MNLSCLNLNIIYFAVFFLSSLLWVAPGLRRYQQEFSKIIQAHFYEE